MISPRPRLLRSPKLLAVLAAAVVFTMALLVLSGLRGGSPEAPPAPPRTFARDTDGQIAQAQAILARDPANDNALTLLAQSSLQKYREVGDPGWYTRAEEAAARALAVNPGNAEAMDALALLALARHRWPQALAWTRRSLRAAPGRFEPVGLQGDALLELGRYREAFAAVEARLSLRPDLASYTRASYVRELRGDRALATRYMSLAVDTARPGSEARTWTRVQLGLLLFGSGKLAAAESQMRHALAELPGDARASAGLARVLAARGRLSQAAELYSRAIDRLPLPEYPAALAEIHLALGDRAAAAADLELVRGMQALLGAAGVRTDLDLAVIEADFARPSPGQVANARAARSARPGVVGDEILGWVLTRAGRCTEGLAVARRSLRLGTRDALTFFHAGMAASCAGRSDQAAQWLRAALGLNPRFSVRWAPVARRTLAGLGA